MSYLYGQSKMREYVWTVVLGCMLLFGALQLTSCQSVPTPQTPKQVLAVADSSLTGLINAAATARAGGLLSAADVSIFQTKALEIEAILNTAQVALDAGDQALAAINTSNARDMLIVLNRLLIELETRQ